MEQKEGYSTDELVAYAILLYEGIVTEAEYQERLDALFLAHPEDRMLLDLECEPDIRKAIRCIQNRINDLNMDDKKFETTILRFLRDYYTCCSDIRLFSSKIYSLWQCLPNRIQKRDPFWSLYWADDPQTWGDYDPFSDGDENKTRTIYEKMLTYYD